MRYVWEVRTIGGDAAQINAAVTEAVEALRSGLQVTGLDDDEVEPWTKDVSWALVSTTAAEGQGTSTLVDVDLYEGSDVAAVLSGGFDEVVLDRVLQVDGVITASHSDRIRRGGEAHG